MSLKRVFPDTGVLLAMIVFPRDRSGSTTLAGEVLELYELSNDFQAFHTPQAKVFWRQHDITVESLYGLLCVFGRRERKGEPEFPLEG